MHHKNSTGIKRSAPLVLLLAGFSAAAAFAQTNDAIPTLQIKADQVTAKVSPTLYGLMTEEINFSYEGGLYGELIRNRAFKADAIQEPIKPENYDPAKYYPVKIAGTNAPKFWRAVGSAKISLDTNTPLNAALNVSLKLAVGGATKNSPAGVANGGYWGIPLKPNTTYHASFYAKAKNFNGPLTVSLIHVVSTNQQILKSRDFEWHLGGMTITAASATVPKISDEWQKHEVTLTTGDIAPSKDNQLVISTTKPGTFWNHHGTVWLQQVSLMPPTFKDRPNGNRADISKLLGDMHPKFLRFPGGNYVEGDYFNERFNWKETIGPVESRPGHRSCWGYWSTDGFGLPEFLGWCQDLNMEPVLAVFAGYTLKHDYIPAGPKLEPYVQEALEEIEYVTGDASTKWGAQRIKDGYPNPFKLRYVEIGNEDWFDRSGSYDGRFAQFYDAIKAKYPSLQLIATAKVKSRPPDLLDEHLYPDSQEAMEARAHEYDTHERTGPKIFVGEWATRSGAPTPNMGGALGDAAWMTGLERNSDLILISCYAPLFVNVSDVSNPDRAARSMQWPSDLIGYDALTSYGSPSYYAQKMFSTHHGDVVLATDSQNIPEISWQPAARKRNGVEQPRPPAKQIKKLFFDATRDSQSGIIYLKVVNGLGTPQPVKVEISGVADIAAEANATVLKASRPEDTNSIQEPMKIVPVAEKVDGLGTDFTRTFPPYSITILELQAR